METQILGHVMEDVVIFFTFKVTKFVYWSTNYFGGRVFSPKQNYKKVGGVFINYSVKKYAWDFVFYLLTFTNMAVVFLHT